MPVLDKQTNTAMYECPECGYLTNILFHINDHDICTQCMKRVKVKDESISNNIEDTKEH